MTKARFSATIAKNTDTLRPRAQTKESRANKPPPSLLATLLESRQAQLPQLLLPCCPAQTEPVQQI
jgi:hypothetical protein